MYKNVKKIIATPKWIYFLLIGSALVFILSAIVGGIVTENYVPSSQKGQYKDFLYVEENAGAYAYIDATEIGFPMYCSDGNTYYVVSDYIDDEHSYYWYIVTLTNYTLDNMSRQQVRFEDSNAEITPYRLYGKTMKPKMDVIDELIDALDMEDYNEFYGTFGSSVLNVKAARNQTLETIATFGLGFGFLAFVAAVIMAILAPFKNRAARIHLKRNNTMAIADEEIAIQGSSANFFFTDHFVVNRTLKTIIYTPDILLITPVNNGGKQYLMAYTRNKEKLPVMTLTGSSSFEIVIDKLKQINPDLLIGASPDNLIKYNELINK